MPGLFSQFSDYFNLNRAERRGLIVLLALLIMINIGSLFLPFLVENRSAAEPGFEEEFSEFFLKQDQMADSLIAVSSLGVPVLSSEKNEVEMFYFDPNGLPVSKWKKLGLTEKQITVIKNYENKGGRFEKPSDLQKI